MSKVNQPPAWLKPTLQKHLMLIAEELPAEYKLTLICRHTKLENAQIVMTDDDLKLAKEALKKSLGLEAL